MERPATDPRLRAIPPAHAILASDEARSLEASLSRDALRGLVREVLASLRARVLDGSVGGDREALTHLAAQELKVVLHLASHPGKTFSRDELLAAVWGYGYEGTARTVDNFISQLRSKLEPDPDAPKHLVTVRGQGYRLDVS